MKINCICFTSGNEIWVGTEAARLANISGEGLHFIASFDNIPERKLWSTPWGGLPDVRSLSVSTDGTIYVNIHVGWIVQSRDEGETWTTLQKGLEKDVHHVV